MTTDLAKAAENLAASIADASDRRIGIVGVLLIDEREDGLVELAFQIHGGRVSTARARDSIDALTERVRVAIRAACDAQAAADGTFAIDNDHAGSIVRGGDA